MQAGCAGPWRQTPPCWQGPAPQAPTAVSQAAPLDPGGHRHRKPRSPGALTHVALPGQGLETQGSGSSSQPLPKRRAVSAQGQLWSSEASLQVELFWQECERHSVSFSLQKESFFNKCQEYC